MTHARRQHSTFGWVIVALSAGLACSSTDSDAGTALNAEVPAPVPADDSALPPVAGGGDSFGSGAVAPGPSGSPGGEALTDAPSGTSAAPITPIDSDIGGNTSLPPPIDNTPGTLTAGAWDDNMNIERFITYRNSLFDQQLPGVMDFTEEEHRQAAADAVVEAHQKLDIALVIDTTASMTDELFFLQVEFDALSAAIEAEYPDAEQRWSLVVYRDRGDEYTTRTVDFMAAGADYRDQLAAQSSGGGGDYPEAADAALEAMNQLSWRSEAGVARIAFWVADAPHHAERAATLASAIRAAQTQGIHVYPVASSGVDEITELSMRSAAQLTSGRYLFLTDDSGVGNSHKEPSIPCYFVTKLEAAILRMVDIEMTGVYREPEASEIIRTSGDPTDGACQLEAGVAYAF